MTLVETFRYLLKPLSAKYDYFVVKLVLKEGQCFGLLLTPPTIFSASGLIRVSMVKYGSVAERAGIQVKDRLFSINNQLCHEMEKKKWKSYSDRTRDRTLVIIILRHKTRPLPETGIVAPTRQNIQTHHEIRFDNLNQPEVVEDSFSSCSSIQSMASDQRDFFPSFSPDAPLQIPSQDCDPHPSAQAVLHKSLGVMDRFVHNQQIPDQSDISSISKSNLDDSSILRCWDEPSFVERPLEEDSLQYRYLQVCQENSPNPFVSPGYERNTSTPFEVPLSVSYNGTFEQQFGKPKFAEVGRIQTVDRSKIDARRLVFDSPFESPLVDRCSHSSVRTPTMASICGESVFNPEDYETNDNCSVVDELILQDRFKDYRPSPLLKRSNSTPLPVVINPYVLNEAMKKLKPVVSPGKSDL